MSKVMNPCLINLDKTKELVTIMGSPNEFPLCLALGKWFLKIMAITLV